MAGALRQRTCFASTAGAEPQAMCMLLAAGTTTSSGDLLPGACISSGRHCAHCFACPTPQHHVPPSPCSCTSTHCAEYTTVQ
jgi:hypothetical protein